MIKAHCESCGKKVSPTALFQDAKTLKSFCEHCFVESMFEEKDVVKNSDKKNTTKYIKD